MGLSKIFLKTKKKNRFYRFRGEGQLCNEFSTATKFKINQKLKSFKQNSI